MNAQHFHQRILTASWRGIFQPAALVGATAVALVILSGCAWNRPTFSERTIATNGVVTERTLRITTFALWPATTSLDKQRASMGKTWSMGQSGVNEDLGSTNITATIDALIRLYQVIKP